MNATYLDVTHPTTDDNLGNNINIPDLGND